MQTTPDLQDTDPYTTRVTHLRIFSDGSEWFLDGSDGAGRYTESCWTFDSFEEAVAAQPEFVANQPANGVVFEWRSPRTIPSWYTSQDVSWSAEGTFSVEPTWSVYREQYLPEHWDGGEPVDGSQVLVSTHATQAEADAEATRLWREHGSHTACKA